MRARERPARVAPEELAARRAPPTVAEKPAAAPSAPKPVLFRRDWRRQAVVMREILGPPRALCASVADPVVR
jgi:hypothetical protein